MKEREKCLSECDYNTAISMVKKDGLLLRFIKNQDLQICIEAVKQNRFAVQYVDKKLFLGDKK